MITLGGDAELELVDSLDPFSEGIVFSVRPPKKSWKNISNLSGGEKTLSSLALVREGERERERERESERGGKRLRLFYLTPAGLCSASLQAQSTLRDGRD